MSIFEDLKHTTDKTSDIGERYIRASHQYFRLKVFQQLTISLSMAVKVLVVGTFLFGGLIFLSIAGAIELGNELDSYSLGFLLVGLIYMVLSLIFYVFRRAFNTFVIKKIGVKFFN